MGHVRNYTLGDLVARYKKAQGYNVLHPMGWDSFANASRKSYMENKTHPSKWTNSNIQNMKIQLKKWVCLMTGKELSTCDPDYYKFEQKMFLDFYKAGIAYKKETLVNWDPIENTVLANEQVVDGRGWRSGAEVEKKKMKGWFLKISHFADDLLNEIDNLNGWPEKVKTMQRNWIGKSYGAIINFSLQNSSKKISVFTTRPTQFLEQLLLRYHLNIHLQNKLPTKTLKVTDFIKFCEKNSIKSRYRKR